MLTIQNEYLRTLNVGKLINFLINFRFRWSRSPRLARFIEYESGVDVSFARHLVVRHQPHHLTPRRKSNVIWQRRRSRLIWQRCVCVCRNHLVSSTWTAKNGDKTLNFLHFTEKKWIEEKRQNKNFSNFKWQNI